MLKWFLRILYAFLVLIIGFFVYNEALINRRIKYLEEHAQASYDLNNMDEYLENYYVAAGRSEYLVTPLYTASSTKANYEFDFSIYHSKIITGDKTVSVVGFTLHNLNLNIVPEDLKKYEANNNLIKINMTIKYNHPNQISVHDINQNGHYMPSGQPYSMGVTVPLEVEVTKSELDVPVFIIRDKIVSDIESIKISVIDSSASLEKPNEELIAILNSNKVKDDQNYYNVREELVDLPYTVEVINDEGEKEEQTINVLQSSLFNGVASRYDVGNQYETSNVSVVDGSLINQYNGIIAKFLAIYILVIVVVTYLIFFLKPTINYFRDKNLYKKIESKE